MKDTNRGPRVSRRYRYTENYTVHTGVAPDGSRTEHIEYTGAYYLPRHPAETYQAVRRTAGITAAAVWCSILLLLGMKGFSVYSGGLYALVPVTASAIPALYFLLGSLKLPKDDRRLQTDTYLFSVARMKKSAAGLLVLFGITALLAVLFFILSKPGFRTADILFAVLVLMPVCILILYLRKERQLSYQTEESEDKDENTQETART